MSMSKVVPVSEAKARLTELVHASEDEDVMLLRHGRPVARIVSEARYTALIERLEDALDKLALHERDGVTLDFDKLSAELGFSD